MNYIDIIKKISNKSFNSSNGWELMTDKLRDYLENEDINLYYYNCIQPQVFHWPQDAKQCMIQLLVLEQNKNNIFYKTIIKKNNYGPSGIKLYKNVQLDRVNHTWSIYNMVEILKLNLSSNNEIIFEFGGGTGQMADILNELNFRGIHIVYDLPLMTILQKKFIDKINIQNEHILDNEYISLTNKTYYLPCNQSDSEKQIINLPNLNFIATYSLTETDNETHKKFAKYMKNFSRIFIIYWPQPCPMFNNINNEEYIQEIKKNIEDTHNCYIGSNYAYTAGNTFYAIKKDLMKEEIIPPIGI